MSWIRKAAGGRRRGNRMPGGRDHGKQIPGSRGHGNRMPGSRRHGYCLPEGVKAPEKQKERKYADGYLTVFLTLSITVLLPLVLTLVEGARINAIRMKTEIAGNTAVRSVLGEFNKELLKQYDLYFVDCSYGTGSASLENVQQHLSTYMEKNLDTEVSSILGINGDFTGTHLTGLTVDKARFAADGGARALREQIYAYMSADPAGSIAAPFLSQVDTIQSLFDDSAKWEEKRTKAREDFKKELRRAKKKAKKAKKEEREEAEEDSDDTAEKAVEEMDRFRLLPILRQVFGDLSGISTASAGDNILSSRAGHYGDTLEAENSHKYPEAGAVMFDLYIGEKCGCYTHPLEKGKLKYQQEYILNGKGTDRENLEKTAEKLLLMREAANCAYIFTDSVRMGQAEMIAALIAFIFFNPQLKDALKNVLLFAWAYLESVQDLRILFDGGRVPVMKSSDTWKTSLLGMLTPESSISGGSGGRGLSYTEYLQTLLFLEGSSLKSLRTMDVMEMDIRKTPGNGNFCMDWCMDVFSMTANVKSRFGYEFTLTRTEGYD